MLTPGYYLLKMTHILGFTLDVSGVLGGCEYELGMGKCSAPSPCFWGFLRESPPQTSMSFTDYGSALAEHIDSQMQRFITTSLIH